MDTRFHLNSDGDHITVENVQDVEPILDRNAALRAEPQKSDWGRHVATIPDVIINKWLNEEYEKGNTDIRFLGPGFDALVARKLKDPDWSYLRTDNPSNPFHLGWREKTWR